MGEVKEKGLWRRGTLKGKFVLGENGIERFVPDEPVEEK